MLDTRASYADALFNAIDERAGSDEEFLAERLAMSPERCARPRDKLLVGSPAGRERCARDEISSSTAGSSGLDRHRCRSRRAEERRHSWSPRDLIRSSAHELSRQPSERDGIRHHAQCCEMRKIPRKTTVRSWPIAGTNPDAVRDFPSLKTAR
jgi:hypothetical protein